MVKWLAYTFGNFFSNKLSKEGSKRSLWNIIFALFIYLILLTSFLAAGYSFSYWTHYNNSDEFKEFVYETFYNEDENKRVNVSINNIDSESSFANAYYGLDKNNTALINTFENAADNIYKINDYNLIVDTRDSSNTFVKFEVSYYNQNDKTDVISADEYRLLTDNNTYVGDVKITNELISYSDQQIIEYASWLNVFTSTLDSTNTYVSEWNTIKTLNKEEKEYKDKTFALYNRAYYSLSITPTVQTYYQYTYAVLDENNEYKYKDYIIITDTWCLISFTTTKGVNVTFDGYYNAIEDGFTLCTAQTNSYDIVCENVDTFFDSVFDSISSVKALYTGVTVFRFYPYLILATLILAALPLLYAKYKKREYCINYVEGLKIVSGYILISTVIAGLIGFIASFVSTQQIAFAIAAWGTLVCLFIRTILFIVIEEVNIKKDDEMVKINKALGIEIEEKKEIKKAEVDDEFKMGKIK